AVNVGAHLSDEAVERGDAVEHDLDGLVWEAGFEREGVACENVVGRVRASVEEVRVAQVEERAHQPRAVLRLVQVDVAALDVRVDSEAYGLVVRHADDDLDGVGVDKAVSLDADEVVGLFVALAEVNADALLRAGDGEQLAELLARGVARGLLLLRPLRGSRASAQEHGERSD